jgi:hypothetical protein
MRRPVREFKLSSMSALASDAIRAEINLALHAQQGKAFQSPATEILYGGAAGGGKSHLMRVCAIAWCAQIPGLQVYLFRRTKDDLVKNHIEGPKGLRAMLADWERVGLARILEDEIRFWNGSKIYLCHCKDEKHRFKYLGAEIHVLLIDELTTFTEIIYRFLRARVRAVGLNLPPDLVGFFPRILCSSNPGNVGHHFVKQMWQPHQVAQHMQVRQMSDAEGGMRRQYIPAKLADNPSMSLDDPGYRARLRGLGSPALVKAMEEGDWNVVTGAYFPEFSTARHIIRPFQIPEHWVRLRAADWGSAHPFAIGWYAVSDGTMTIPEWDGWSEMPGPLVIPRGALVKYREWYGIQHDADGNFQANVGLKLTAEEVADGILAREQIGVDDDGHPIYEKIDYSVLDPSAFQHHSGPSIGERMATRRVYFTRADNTRVGTRGALGGWDLLRARLKGEEEHGVPMLFFFSTCEHTIRTVPALQHDEMRIEDVNTKGEDHAGDETRYACSARPWVREIQPQPERRYERSIDLSVEEIISAHRRKKRGDA